MSNPVEVVDAEVRFERQGPAARIVVDRPSARNAISHRVMEELEAILDHLVDEPPAVVTIRGGGDRAFVSGGDLKEFAAIRLAADAERMASRMRRILDRLATLPSITIAVLNGHALGGGAELAVAADFRLAADDIKIGFSQITLGITPAWGGIERLAGLVGRARAAYLLATGVIVDARQGAEWGLIEEVVPRPQLDARAEELESSLSGRPVHALHTIKAILARSQPAVHEATAADAVRRFAESWVSEAHWSAVANTGKG
jgi:enoyl-CoA hydratase